jgi:hypothetical protein
MTALERAVRWVKNHPWWVAFLFVIFAGYTIGADRAQRDNALDAYMRAGDA